MATLVRPSPRRCAAGVLVALSLLLGAACGDDNDTRDDEIETTTPATDAPGQTGGEAPIVENGADLEPDPDDTDGGGESGDGIDGESDDELIAAICGYFNPGGLAEIVGEPVGEPRLRGATCSVRAVDSVSTARVSVEVEHEPEAYERQLDRLPLDEELDDIGEEAFRSGTTVVVRSGDTVMTATAQANLGGTHEVDPGDVVYLAELLAGLTL